MAEPLEHVREWQANQRRAQSYAAQFEDDKAWAIVFLFYAAVHLVEACMRTKGSRFFAENHRERWEAIRNAPELGTRFRAAYRSLQALSVNVRYDPTFHARDEDHAAAHAHLVVVTSFLRAKLSRALGVDLETLG